MSTDESLAKALGWTQGYGGHWKSPDGYYDMAFPEWSADMNACLRDIVPVLRARGMEVTLEIERLHPNEWAATITQYKDGMIHADWGEFNVSLPAAFCEAALAALEATNEAKCTHIWEPRLTRAVCQLCGAFQETPNA